MNRQERQLLELVQQRVVQMSDKVEKDPYRLHYHLMPPVGLLNDPNGFIQYKGKYHLFYQWNPFATTHGAKFWGHYTSSDFIKWVEEPIALAPIENYERNGCYSGSAIEHDGKLYIFYTGNVKNGANRETYQCLAVSEDGISFKKKGPIITLPDGFTAHFRDPKVWKYKEKWYMVIGAQDISEQGCVVLYSSHNLMDWDYEAVLAGSKRNGLPYFGYMWECPDLFSLKNREVFIFSPQGLESDGIYYRNIFQSGYVLGNLEYDTNTFSHGEFTELDRGFDFYAPQTMQDNRGRRILFAWMGITDEQEQQQPTIHNNWVHAMTIPRELQLKDEKLFQVPVQELQELRKNEVVYPSIALSKEKKSFPDINGEAMEIILHHIWTDLLDTFTITIRNYVKIIYKKHQNYILLQRKMIKENKWEERISEIDTLTKLHIYLDTSSLELFVNDGAEVFSARIFPSYADREIVFDVKGDISFQLKKWDLRKMKVERMWNRIALAKE